MPTLSKPQRQRQSAAPAGPRPRATLAQVAQAASVAPATVSGILNNRADCYASDATRQRVYDTARRLGYRPNLVARALSGKGTATLGLVVPGLASEISGLKFLGFETAARAQRYLTLVTSTNNEPALEDQAIRWLLDRCVDAIAVLPTERGRHDELRQLTQSGFPVVTLDAHGLLDFPVDDVSVDAHAGGRLAIEHLLSLGRRRILLAGNAQRCMLNDHKLAGMQAALRDAGLPVPARMDVSHNMVMLAAFDPLAFEPLRQYLAAHRGQFDAVCCLGDSLALPVMRFVLEQGLRVPQDVAITGYDAMALSGHVPLPLTTVRHALEDVGRLAFDLLAQRLAGERAASDVRRHLVPPQLLVRASTAGSTTNLTTGTSA